MSPVFRYINGTIEILNQTKSRVAMKKPLFFFSVFLLFFGLSSNVFVGPAFAANDEEMTFEEPETTSPQPASSPAVPPKIESKKAEPKKIEPAKDSGSVPTAKRGGPTTVPKASRYSNGVTTGATNGKAVEQKPTPSSPTAKQPAVSQPAKSEPNVESQQEEGGSVFDAFSSLLSGKKSVKRNDPKPQRPDRPLNDDIDAVIPENALVVAKSPSLKTLEECVGFMMTKLGYGSISPTDYLKLTPYGRILPALDMERSAAVIYFPFHQKPVSMVILPVLDARFFLQGLGAKLDQKQKEIPDGVPFTLRTPKNYLCWMNRDYAVIVDPVTAEEISNVIQTPAWKKNRRYLPPGLVRSHFEVHLTRFGIEQMHELGFSALQDSRSFIFEKANESRANIQDFDPAMVSARLVNFGNWVKTNVQELRVDILLKENETVTGTTVVPFPHSELERQNNATFRPGVGTTLDIGSFRPNATGTFLKVLPTYTAPIAGQVDLIPEVAARLEPPFNRIRHIEYSITLPGDGQLLAENWSFFLEVDNSELFLKELIVPKAQMVGSHIGSQTLSELGAKVLGNLAVRRQNRQAGRGRNARFPANPEAAAEFGARIGEKLGTEVGANMGVKEAMKLYSFGGYPLLVSDLVRYTKAMREIKAQEAGMATRPPIQLTGEPTLRMLMGQVVQGLQNGGLEDIIANMTSENASLLKDAPLMATQNLFVILDPQHILIVPGNQQVMNDAVTNWEAVKSAFFSKPNAPIPPAPEEVEGNQLTAYPQYTPLVVGASRPELPLNEGPAFSGLWESIREEIPYPRQQTIRTVTQVDPYAGQLLREYVIKNYFPNYKPPMKLNLADNTPFILYVSTTGQGTGRLFSGIPHLFFRNVLAAWMEK